MNKTPLTKPQQELLDALRAGLFCHYMKYMGRFNASPYYFLSGTTKRCTAQVEVLLKRGLAEKFEVKTFGDHKVRVSQEGRQP